MQLDQLEQMLTHLERKAVSAMQNLNPQTANIHDYRNILFPVDRAMRAVNAAYIAVNKADMRLDEIKARQ